MDACDAGGIVIGGTGGQKPAEGAVSAELLLDVYGETAAVVSLAGGPKGLDTVGSWPESCQVFRDPADFKNIAPVVGADVVKRVVSDRSVV